jgi:hypothetical protein
LYRMPGKSKKASKGSNLWLEMESAAASVQEKLLTKRNMGELDILTVLELIELRVQYGAVAGFLEEAPETGKEVESLRRCLETLKVFQFQVEEYLQNERLRSSVKAFLAEEIDRRGFAEIKEDWFDLRKSLMFQLKINSAKVTRQFVFLECVFRMLLIWHEEQGLENTRKNLRLIDHLMVKYDLNSLLKEHVDVIRCMHILGKKYDNINLRNKLKSETISPPHAEAKELLPQELKHPLENSIAIPRPFKKTQVLESREITEEISRPSETRREQGLEPPPDLDMPSLPFIFPGVSETKEQIVPQPAPSEPIDKLADSFPQAAENVQQTFPNINYMMDTSFLSEKSDSSISFLDNEERRQASMSKRASGKEPARADGDFLASRSVNLGRSGAKSNKKSARSRVEVDKDIREVTQERLFKKLLALLPESKARITAKNFEARLFGLYYLDENSYDSKYTKIISFLESVSATPVLLACLIDNYFDFDFVINKTAICSQEETQLGKRSLHKTTQTFAANPNPLDPRNMSPLLERSPLLKKDRATGFSAENADIDDKTQQMIMNLKESETQYLQKLVNQIRQENEFLKKTIFELRLKEQQE